ncbi:aromatic compound dioxygenase [Aureobasidium sp. EXF-8845]|nr:aromatic compound dioxygenase [Aureobasidium sp. EXF-8845]KAI4856980.1 aromatic compound dioxygenase [Aureobasidium sp. EXF-8846]
MVHFPKVCSTIAAAAFITPSLAHPGEHHDHHAVEREIAAREHLANHFRHSVDTCSGTESSASLAARSIARRSETVNELHLKRGIASSPQKFRRDLATLEKFEAVNHNQTDSVDGSVSTFEASVFSANTSHVLTPEVTDGPYYVTGEQIRSNVKEDLYSDGVDLYLEVQYIDITTCKPVSNVWVDIWNANATGVYSGISVSGNYAADGYNSTYLRGIQETDSDGVASFETIFPGHYEGHATHTHLLSHMNVTVFPNNTISATNNITHIGQLFWDTALRAAVEEVYPYNTNTQAVTNNDEDMWDIVQAGTTYDPFPQYIYLGDDISDGLFAWIQIGLDTTANYIDAEYYAVAAYLDADGGHTSSSSFIGGGSGAGDGGDAHNGTAPGDANASGSGAPSGTGGGSGNGPPPGTGTVSRTSSTSQSASTVKTSSSASKVSTSAKHSSSTSTKHSSSTKSSSTSKSSSSIRKGSPLSKPSSTVKNIASIAKISSSAKKSSITKSNPTTKKNTSISKGSSTVKKNISISKKSPTSKTTGPVVRKSSSSGKRSSFVKKSSSTTKHTNF